jgi:lysophospholipase L1-like esterase
MTGINRRHLLAFGAVAGASSLARAAEPAPLPAPPPLDPVKEQRLHEDWAYLDRYRTDNAAAASSGTAIDAVFMGDSITEGWLSKNPAFFSARRICRGISGQTTPQMLVRFRADVIALKPRVVHIMAGTNDVAGNTGPMTVEMSQGNLMSMTELAQANGVRVVLASIPPAASFPWRPGVETVGPITAINAWLKAYCARAGATYADYFSAMSDGKGGMKNGLAYDGVHPTEAGYSVMDPIAEAALREAEGKPVGGGHSRSFWPF